MNRNELFLQRLDLEDDEDFPFNEEKQKLHADLWKQIQDLDKEAARAEPAA